MKLKTYWREATSVDGDMCLLSPAGKLYYGLTNQGDNGEIMARGSRCRKDIAHVGRRKWTKPI